MELRERYEEDLALVLGLPAWLGLLVALAVLVLFPLLAPRYLVYIVTLMAIHILVAIGLNLLTGYTGQISLGHAGFVAIGAYTAGLLMVRVGVPFPFAFLLSGFSAAFFGFLLGLPVLRLTGPYLTIATLGFGIAVHQVLTNWEGLSGGRMGLFIPKPSIGPWTLASEAALYYLAVGTTGVLTWIAYNLVRSHIGRAFVAIRDSDVAAEVMGVNLMVYKTLAFGLSAFYAGVAGALQGHLLGYIEPQMFTLFESIYYFSMIVVGGLGTIPGSILGAVLMTILPQVLSGLREWLPIVYGGTIIFIMAVEPWGLYGRWLRIKWWLKTWPF
ncbi:MAG: branched-chain amino acid ABC transporter permease [Armatimonadota bacterium]|nr:branched-chain amino acid ABC transporter permease [Armatimonadota bacterium]MDR5702896.1 branched-chain amino acid ABC transporter permease [Armatimonadota bacterium]MDR7434787.1 branched-chain amino acid ABC transporter permease [Armatimonadota bacterium]